MSTFFYWHGFVGQIIQSVDLLSFLRRLHRFSTDSHPAALDACYLAA
jgi:hypothetical protein